MPRSQFPYCAGCTVARHYVDREWITLTEAAQILRVSPQTLRKYADQIGIRTRTFFTGKRLVWNKADAEAAIAKMMAEAGLGPAQPAQPAPESGAD